MNSSLEKLVRNLADKDFIYLTRELDSKNSEPLKQKGAYSYEYMHSFKKYSEEKLPDKKYFYRSLKDVTTGDNSEKLDGQISYGDCNFVGQFGINLTQKIWLIITIIV